MNRPAEIFVRWIAPGFHAWEGAPAQRDYLASQHRHLFHFEVRMIVPHDDRSTEFHDLLHDAKSHLLDIAKSGRDGALVFGPRSCEMIGRELADKLAAQYQRAVTVTVSEDGECGATVLVGSNP